MSEILKYSNVHAFYDKAHILHGIDFNVQSGDSVALLGRNGVGKTTTVNTLLGIADMREGEIAIKGRDYRKLRHYTAAREGVSIVLQGKYILPNLTVEENLKLGAAVGRKGQWTLDTIFNLFPILKERADTPGTALSGGQQQMLAIGRALMANPDLLVLDEPSEGLAPVIIEELGDVFCKLAAEGIAILLIEQNLHLVRQVAKRYYVMTKGSIIDSGSLEGLTIEDLQHHVSV